MNPLKPRSELMKLSVRQLVEELVIAYERIEDRDAVIKEQQAIIAADTEELLRRQSSLDKYSKDLSTAYQALDIIKSMIEAGPVHYDNPDIKH